MRRIRLIKLDPEGLLFALNGLIFISLGATILRITEIAKLYRARIELISPSYTSYVDFGTVAGYALLAFAVLQIFMAAMKFYNALELQRLELDLERLEKLAGMVKGAESEEVVSYATD
ncbi:MAG: hypothetical protein H0Z28_10265 [Archaeoglobus sp.]|nr:hypothetical protein [Archaeoglobus sp.]